MYIIPQPSKLQYRSGAFTVACGSSIILGETASPDCLGYAELLRKDILKYCGYELNITRSQSAGGIRLEIGTDQAEQEYRLEADTDEVLLQGGSQAGLLYAVQTLRQILRQCGPVIPALVIEDRPDIPARGFFHDVTRGRVPTLEQLKKLADTMAYYKLNQLQLYIEHTFMFEGMSEVWRDDTPLTAEDILDLDRYCRQLNIDLVPNVSCFGHLYKVLKTKSFRHLCEFEEDADRPFSLIERMAHHTLNITDPESFEFVRKMIDEYMPLFTSKYFNIGADETFDLGKGKSRAKAEEEGTERLYVGFVKKLCDYVVSKGRIPMFWGDIICKTPELVRELPEGTICLNWGYGADQRPKETELLARAGATQYCCPGVSGWNCFINHIWNSYENNRRMCSYAREYGAIGILNTDWGDFGHINHPDMSRIGMIYGAAMSWSGTELTFEELNRQISAVEYMDRNEKVVSVISDLSCSMSWSWHDAVNVMEGKNTFNMERVSCENTEKTVKAVRELTQKLYEAASGMDTEKRKELKPFFIGARGMELFQRCGYELAHKELPRQTERTALAEELEVWFMEYKNSWREVSRESELIRIQNVVIWYADELRG